MSGRIGHHLNEFLPNLITGRIGWLNWSNWVEIHRDDAQSNRLNLTNVKEHLSHHLSGFPPNLTDLTRQAYNVISMDFHPI